MVIKKIWKCKKSLQIKSVHYSYSAIVNVDETLESRIKFKTAMVMATQNECQLSIMIKWWKDKSRIYIVMLLSFWSFEVFCKYKLTEAVAKRCSVKECFLQISHNSHETTGTESIFLIKLWNKACNFAKKENKIF